VVCGAAWGLLRIWPVQLRSELALNAVEGAGPGWELGGDAIGIVSRFGGNPFLSSKLAELAAFTFTETSKRRLSATEWT